MDPSPQCTTLHTRQFVEKKKLEEVTTWKRSATGNRTDFLPQRKHSRGSEKLGNGMWSSYRYEPNGHRRFTPSSLPPWFSLSPHQPWTPLVSHDIYEWESFFLVLSLLKINDMPWICHDSTCHCRVCACVWRVCVSGRIHFKCGSDWRKRAVCWCVDFNSLCSGSSAEGHSV